jgi:hypothetical protein
MLPLAIVCALPSTIMQSRENIRVRGNLALNLNEGVFDRLEVVLALDLRRVYVTPLLHWAGRLTLGQASKQEEARLSQGYPRMRAQLPVQSGGRETFLKGVRWELKTDWRNFGGLRNFGFGS